MISKQFCEQLIERLLIEGEVYVDIPAEDGLKYFRERLSKYKFMHNQSIKEEPSLMIMRLKTELVEDQGEWLTVRVQAIMPGSASSALPRFIKGPKTKHAKLRNGS